MNRYVMSFVSALTMVGCSSGATYTVTNDVNCVESQQRVIDQRGRPDSVDNHSRYGYFSSDYYYDAGIVVTFEYRNGRCRYQTEYYDPN